MFKVYEHKDCGKLSAAEYLAHVKKSWKGVTRELHKNFDKLSGLLTAHQTDIIDDEENSLHSFPLVKVDEPSVIYFRITHIHRAPASSCACFSLFADYADKRCPIGTTDGQPIFAHSIGDILPLVDSPVRTTAAIRTPRRRDDTDSATSNAPNRPKKHNTRSQKQ